jgi:hypothetical protein
VAERRAPPRSVDIIVVPSRTYPPGSRLAYAILRSDPGVSVAVGVLSVGETERIPLSTDAEHRFLVKQPTGPGITVTLPEGQDTVRVTLPECFEIPVVNMTTQPREVHIQDSSRGTFWRSGLIAPGQNKVARLFQSTRGYTVRGLMWGSFPQKGFGAADTTSINITDTGFEIESR